MKLRRGFSLLELVLAIAIFSLGSIATATLLIDSNISTKLSLERTEALFYAKEGIEAVRSIRDNSFANLIDGVHGLISSSTDQWEFTGDSDLISDQYTRTVNITTGEHGTSTKDVSVTIEWALNPARNSSVTLNTIFTDWKLQ